MAFPKRLYAWWTKKSTREELLETLANARVFEEWEASAFQLDEILGYDLWSGNPIVASWSFN
jgi:TAG lipase/lysophosphatidylethanolamine acyltransferase